MKKLLALFVIVIAFSSCGLYRSKLTQQTFNSAVYKTKKTTFSPIIWESDSIGKTIVKRTSFLVPVYINGINKKLYMQFDLGADISILYENTIKKLYKEQNIKLDTLVSKKGNLYIKNVELTINKNVKITAKKFYVWRNMGSSNLNTTRIIVGTLGYDIIGDNILILDFKENRYTLTDNIPESMKAKIQFIDNSDLNKFPIIIPFKLGKKKIRLMYDSGASMFPILTGTNRLKKLSEDGVIDSIGYVNSWGKKIRIYREHELKPSIGNLYIGNIDLGKIDIYGTNMYNKLSFAGRYLFGITGNVIFENKIILIDRKNNRFGIIE